MTSPGLPVACAATHILSSIVADIGDGTIPYGEVIASFSEAHDHVDANEYIAAAAKHYDHPIEDHAFWNEVTAYVDRQLAAGVDLR